MAESVRQLDNGIIELAPRTGTAFTLRKGQRLAVIDPKGSQVADLLAYNAGDTAETMSNGRTFDYNKKIHLTTGDEIYSNRSEIMLRIGEDTVGRHDFLMTPCSAATFRKLYPDQDPAPGCFGNFAFVLEKYGITEDQIPVPFNCFMNVRVDGENGAMNILPPITKAGDHIDFVAEMDLVVALTACSAARSNAGSFKPIQYRVT